MFDRNWRRLPFTTGEPPIDERIFPTPASLGRMIAAAETLSDGMSFVRIDFYEIGGRPRFGEMTFYPGSGWDKFTPSEYDRIVGDMWD